MGCTYIQPRAGLYKYSSFGRSLPRNRKIAVRKIICDANMRAKALGLNILAAFGNAEPLF
jgi:hypothetical protein